MADGKPNAIITFVYKNDGNVEMTMIKHSDGNEIIYNDILDDFVKTHENFRK